MSLLLAPQTGDILCNIHLLMLSSVELTILQNDQYRAGTNRFPTQCACLKKPQMAHHIPTIKIVHLGPHRLATSVALKFDH